MTSEDFLEILKVFFNGLFFLNPIYKSLFFIANFKISFKLKFFMKKNCLLKLKLRYFLLFIQIKYFKLLHY